MTTYSLTRRPKGSCIVLAILWGTAIAVEAWRLAQGGGLA